MRHIISLCESVSDTSKPLTEVSPPGKKAERFIKHQKNDFRKRYGKRWKKVLYATAWKQFGESSNTVLRLFRTKLSESQDAHIAAILTASHLAIDVADVVTVVKEAAHLREYVISEDDDKIRDFNRAIQKDYKIELQRRPTDTKFTINPKYKSKNESEPESKPDEPEPERTGPAADDYSSINKRMKEIEDEKRY